MENGAAVIAELRESLGQVSGVMGEFWQAMMRQRGMPIVHGKNFKFEDWEREEWERESRRQERLAAQLKSLGTQLTVALEMLGLPETQRMFVAKWRTFSESDLQKVDEEHSEEDDWVESEPLKLCQEVFKMIAAPHEDEKSAAERASMDVLEFILASTAKILADRDIAPTGEIELQKPMHAHLSATFASFTTRLTIPKPIVSFLPDCGVIALSAAVEFKFVDSEKELKEAIRGLTEDLSGYAGSLDWTRFFSVIYQTKAFGTEKQCREALRRSGNAEKWRCFLVTGAGGRVRRRPRKR